MRRRRKKPMTAAEARAMQDPRDLAAIASSKAAQHDIVEAKIHCVVCGGPAKTAMLRIHVPDLAGAKWLCPDCEHTGWAWMSTMSEEGSVVEDKAISTVEEEAKKGEHGDSNKVAKELFESTSKMETTRQNPIAQYKSIRNFPDDTLLLHLSKCRDHQGGNESHLWKIWSDDNPTFSL